MSGEGGPPQARRQQADPDRAALGQADPVVQRDQDQVERQQQAAAEVAQRPAAAGDPVALVRRGDPAQQRVVDDQRPAQAEVGEDQQQHAQLPAGAGDEEHAEAAAAPGPGEAANSRVGRGDRSAIAPMTMSTSAETIVDTVSV